MKSIKVKNKGSFSKTEEFLKRANDLYNSGVLDSIAQDAVNELKKASPRRDTNNEQLHIADSWSYEIIKNKKNITIYFNNSIVKDGVNIALIVNDGHLTKTGNWISGQHYIEEPLNNACKRIMEHMKEGL